MADTKISNLPTDIVTLSAGDKFPVADDSDLTADTYATALEIKTYCLSDTSLIRTNANYALANSSTSQVLFPSPNTLTLTTGSYIFDSVLYFAGMSATSGNALFDIKGAGTVSMPYVTMQCFGIDGVGTAANQTGTWSTSSASAANMVSASTATTLFVRARGYFAIDAAGTIIPSVTLQTASAASLSIGSFLSVTRLGTTSLTNIGAWS